MADQVRNLRNWFSDLFGIREISIEEENELLKKLKETFDDSSAWATTAHGCEERLPKHPVALQLELQARLDKSMAEIKQAKATKDGRRSIVRIYGYTAELPSSSYTIWPRGYEDF
ncbi:hypothetical protein PtrSN002B_008951 [Pyrenophora tritici-repentis]|uniref:Uncharacterized protein n=1 Tax=Pyrenophora tritici-repentis TaxID=45151 RepID=A0A2W1DGQ0_9PLEO|nr:hypothetical protein TUN199_03939 [Pyrenophora tritici-repentis]KAI1515727.1 hypothetical protein Ptr86124_005728 [Pyrenophora tritici-repentis]KAI1531203.1 hypothetical protein PtrSN001A_007802 [Pyrenophora tritici-repentis]KAI1539260.1 hypothetical protein PtrSN002B_008951 [Pyrenophora tritici-repentis]KAI1571185.1 hypothetical protein PtrEW7m1_007944 [Pyrenophora tritici-repentis]